MPSFVPAGTAQDAAEPAAETSDAWAKAQQHINDARNRKPADQGTQEDGRSLYEVLQANKAAKQEAFEESTKIKNQFRPLDDTEIEFLDSVRQSELQKEATVKQETAEQLDAFRRQRVAAEQEITRQSQRSAPDATVLSKSNDMWTAAKKRRRPVDADDARSTVKHKALLEPKSNEVEDRVAPSTVPDKPSRENIEPTTNSTGSNLQSPPADSTGQTQSSTPRPGLVAYDSSDGDSNDDD